MRIRCLLIAVAVMFTAGVLTTPGYAELDPETIAAIWLFDEGGGDIARDSSGNENDGNLIGGPKRVNGKFDRALEFDGVDDYVDVSYDSSLKLGNDGTIALWFKPANLEADTHTLISYGGTSYSTGHLLSHYLSLTLLK